MISIRQNVGVKMVGCILVVVSLVLVGISMTQATTTTLVIVDEATEEPEQTAFQKVLNGFEKLNPDIVIKRETIGLWESTDVMKTALRTGTGPDVLEYSGGPAWMGVLALGGLLTDLTEEYKKFGWEKEFAPWAKFVLPQIIYEGKYWAVPYGSEHLVMFYNKRMFKEVGITKTPNGYEELLTVCDKLKAAGYQPMIIGNNQGWGGAQALDMMWGINDAREVIKNIWYRGGSWESPKLIDGLSKLLTLFEKGYLNKDANALSEDDLPMLFMTEEGAMWPTGSWQEGYMSENVPFEYSIFNPLPEGHVAVNLRRAFCIPETTKHKNEALRLVRYLMTFEVQKSMLEEGGRYPNGWLDRKYESKIPTIQISLKMLQQPNPQYFCTDASLPPILWDEYYTSVQKLFAGKITPEEEMKQWQNLWKQAIDEEVPRLGM